MDYPKLRRDVSAFPLTVDGRSMICFQDSQGISEGIFIPHDLFARIVSFFDGQNSIRDIQYEAMRRHGELLYTEQIEAVVHQIDKALLLESPRFYGARKRLEDEFRKQSVRPAFFSEKSYVADPAKLKDQVQSYFLGSNGPGLPDRNIRNQGLTGLIAPHIDFQRGGHCYAFAYKALAEAIDADLYIILGIAHAPSEYRFILTLKDFETPLGIVRTDGDFVKALSGRFTHDFFQGELLHRSEHSIEFQVVFLQSVLGPEMRASIVPILCGSFDRYFDEGKIPEEDLTVSQFLDALRSEVAESQKRICFIAGIDLSHVGPQFGDPRSVDSLMCSEIREDDLQGLEKVASLDTDGFFSLIEKYKNRRRMCGFPAIYVLMRTIEANRGEILKYDQGATPDGQSVVSFTAMAFYES